ncbi:G-D-S-L family lipolytic protein [Flavobacterium sp.]|uniref:G-D-S-L family lipolytic protein n=1 Tax=Flavobacterium sp. TaxID=239 RepID=UPI002FD8A6E0
MIKNFKWLLLVSLTFVACNNSDDAIVDPNSTDGTPLTAGTADFSKYVALGDSFAAGYSDGALFKAGQENAYPKIIASQFALVGGGDFTTPFMSDNIGGFSSGGIQVPGLGTRLFLNTATNTPNPVSGISGTDISAHLTGLYNNMGVPGAKSYHLLYDGYAAANPYFGRFASSTSATVLGDALAQSPTFFSLWIGGNDELGYATAGGDASLNPLTPANIFDQAYNMLISQLVAGGRKGVIANLPYVTTLPYFHVIQYNQLTQANLTVGGVSQVNTLNAQLYGPLHNALTYLGQGNRINLLSTTGNNPMLMVDENLTNLSTSLTAVLVGGGLDVPTATALGQIFGRARQTLPTDLICLSAGTRIGQAPSVAVDGVASPSPLLNQLGVTFPLPDRYVLLPTEVTEIETATMAYNATIEAAAVANSETIAIVDAESIMNDLTTGGIVGNGYTMTATYVTGNTFSLDGIHPSPKGYALIANKFLEAINLKFGSNFKGVNLGNYRVLFPQDSASF